ncbi:hypothetical protein [Bradyrhizobium sp. DASA03007]|uniref:hypothetical protein n=1 Tax=unclassified Bradyrhizobium TaxID=2631580 RepID=UPI003F710920
MIDAKEISIGDVASHDRLKSVLVGSELQSYYPAVNRASNELAKTRHCVLRSYRGDGYRLTAGVEQVEIGQNHRKRGVRSIKRGLNLVKLSDRSIMSPEDRKWADKVEGGLVTLATIAVMHDERLNQVSSAVDELRKAQITNKKVQSSTSDEISELRRRIEAIESSGRNT